MRLPWMAWPIRPEFQRASSCHVTDGLGGLDGLLGRPIRQRSKRHTLYMNSKWALNFNEAPENTRWFLATRSCNSPPRALRLIGHGGRSQVSGFSVGSPTQLAFYANQQTRLAHTEAGYCSCPLPPQRPKLRYTNRKSTLFCFLEYVGAHSPTNHFNENFDHTNLKGLRSDGQPEGSQREVDMDYFDSIWPVLDNGPSPRDFIFGINAAPSMNQAPTRCVI